VWQGTEAVPTVVANQLLVQVEFAGDEPDAVLLTVGHASPPVITGSPEEQSRQIQGIEEIAIRPIIRISLTKRRLREWSTLLQDTLSKLDGWPGES
jgi:hypothetical protein